MQDQNPAPGEISEALLEEPVPYVWITVQDPDVGAFQATVGDLREALKPLGLELTTRESVDWAIQYPGSAAARTRICELERERDDLRHQLRAIAPDLFVLRVVK